MESVDTVAAFVECGGKRGEGGGGGEFYNPPGMQRSLGATGTT